tara:strand:- start:1266 stop:1445 length:180 start_codon:yes stop_codon:yes gene_type:complete
VFRHLYLVLVLLLISCGSNPDINISSSLNNSSELSQQAGTSTVFNRFGDCKIGECRFED